MVKYHAGFTLIEILIVLVIISIVTGAVVLKLQINDNKRIESFAKELTAELVLAEEQALLQSVTLGFYLDALHYEFLQRGPDTQKNPWVPLQTRELASRARGKDIKMTFVELASQPASYYPQIIFSSSGDITPFQLFIGKAHQRPSFMIQGYENGEIVLRALNA